MKARYPEDFTAELTPSQIEALNDSIADENQPEQIIQWASGKDYTLLFQDTSGKFASVYGELLKSNSYTAKEIRLEKANVYCAAAADSGGEREILVQEEKDKILIKQNDQDVRTWEKGSDGLLKVMVIDNYNNKVVCEKSFEYMGETFCLIQ